MFWNLRILPSAFANANSAECPSQSITRPRGVVVPSVNLQRVVSERTPKNSLNLAHNSIELCRRMKCSPLRPQQRDTTQQNRMPVVPNKQHAAPPSLPLSHFTSSQNHSRFLLTPQSVTCSYSPLTSLLPPDAPVAPCHHFRGAPRGREDGLRSSVGSSKLKTATASFSILAERAQSRQRRRQV